MAIGIGKAILAGLTGAAQGAATLALAEDERRKEDTQLTFKAGLQAAKTYQELRAESNKELKEELELVESFKDTVVNGQPIGRAGATALVRGAKARGYTNPEDMLQDYNMSGEGSLEIQLPTTVSVLPKGIDLEKDDRGIFAKGRTKSVVSDVETLLKASNVKTEIEIPQKAKVSGVTFTRKDDVGTSSERTTYLFDKGGTPIKPLRTVTTLTDNGTRTVKHFDITTNKPIELAQGQIIGESKDDFVQKQQWKEFGILAVLENGVPKPTSQSAFLMKNGSIRLATPNGPAENVYVPEDENVQYTVISPDKIMEFGGIDKYFSVRNEIAKSEVGKNLQKAVAKADEKAVALESLENYSNIRKGLYDEFGNRMTGAVGIAADAISRISTEVATAYGVVTSFADTEWEEAYASKDEREKARFMYVQEREASLRDVLNNKDDILANISNEAERISVARAIDKSLSILTAYDLAKATGDTRISDADFKAFIQTVRGTSATKSVQLIKSRMDTAITAYASEVKNIDETADRYLGTDAPEDSPITRYVNDQRVKPGSDRHPSAFRKRHEETFGKNSYFNAALSAESAEKAREVSVEGIVFTPSQNGNFVIFEGEDLVDAKTGKPFKFDPDDDAELVRDALKAGLVIKKSQYTK